AIGTEAEIGQPEVHKDARRDGDGGGRGPVMYRGEDSAGSPVGEDLFDEVELVAWVERPLQPSPCAAGGAMALGDIETDDPPERFVGLDRRRDVRAVATRPHGCTFK